MNWLNVAILLLALGVALPWRFDLNFFDPVFFVPYSWFGMFFVAGRVGEVLSRNRKLLDGPPPPVSPRQIRSLAIEGFLFGSALLALGIVTVNAFNWHGDLLTPSSMILAATLVLLAAGCWSFAVMGARWIGAGRGAGEVRGLQRGTLVAIALFLYYRESILPKAIAEPIARTLTDPGISVFCFVTAAILTACGWLLARRKA